MKVLTTRIQNTIAKSENRPHNIFCLGCAVKVPLRTTVFPALKELKRRLSCTNITLNIGNDAYIFETDRKIRLNREICSLSALDNKQGILKNTREITPNGAIILASYLEAVSRQEITTSLFNFCSGIIKADIPFCIGKGHTIKISKIPEQKFILADYLTFKKGDYYAAANNDTIVTIDFNLRHSHWLNVYISLNNALNDLYALGVYKDITLYPVYDSIYEKDNKLIKDNLENYLTNFKRYNYNLVDLGPLGLELEAIGSTVIGFSDREPPRISGLIPGQVLLATRSLGDLASLVLYIIKNTSGKVSRDIKKLKLDVLYKMATPNLEVAKIISDYLPPKGGSFDFRRHITSTKDISGEGLSALEEMALHSKVNVYIEQIKLHNNKAAVLKVPNNTSNTNGPIIIAIHKKRVREIIKRLEGAKCEPWIIGRVGAKTRTPTIYLKREFNRYPFLKYNADKLFKRYQYF